MLYCARICCAYDRIPQPRPQPRLHDPVDRGDDQHAGQPDVDVRLPAGGLRHLGIDAGRRPGPRRHTCSACAATLLPAGVVVDRMDRRTLMIGASAAGVVLYGSLAVAGVLDTLTIPHLVVVALLTGAATGVFGPAQTSAIRTVVPTEDLPTALSQNQAREHVAGLVGAPLGGAALRRHPVAAVRRGRRHLRGLLPHAEPDPDRPGARSGPRAPAAAHRAGRGSAVHGSPALLPGAALLGRARQPRRRTRIFFVALLRMIEDGHGPARIGLTETAAGLGGILGALAAPYLIDRMATGRLTVVIAWALVPPVIPLIWWSSPLAVGISLFALMLLNPAGNAGIGAYRIAVTPDELQGRVAATSQFVAMSVMPLSPLLGGFLLERYGGEVAIAALAVASAGLAVPPHALAQRAPVPRPAEWVTA